MTVTVASFRTVFPAFADAGAYRDDAISFWLGIAGMMLTDRWGSPAPTPALPLTAMVDWGTVLYVAHHLALEDQANKAASRGATPGVQKGAIASDSANGVTRSYNVEAGLELDAGHWGQTIYGNRFLALVKMVGMGPVTIGGGPGYGWFGGGWFGGPFNGPAWPGPPPWPGFFG
jgi:hypothetical protein